LSSNIAKIKLALAAGAVLVGLAAGVGGDLEMTGATLAEPVAPGVPGDNLDAPPAPAPPPPAARVPGRSGAATVRVPFEIRA
jgi:hypothetical protein